MQMCEKNAGYVRERKRALEMNPWVERLGWTLLHFVWEGALIGAVYAIWRRALKTCTPNARYLLACGALAAMAAAPAVTLAVLSDPSVQVASTAWAGGSAAHFSRSAPPSGSSMVWIAAGETSTPPMVWVVLFWLAGAGVFSIRLMGGWWMSMRVRSHRVREAPAEWSEAFARIGALAGVSRPVRLLVSAIVKVPMVVGWLRPVVLVPVGAFTGLPPEHVEALLAHELAHIRRHDYLVNILQSIAEALLFYHPAVWWVSGHVRAERELCCDDMAASASGDVFIYASALAELESLRVDRFGVALSSDGGSLADRVARLLGHERKRTRPGPGVLVNAVLLLVTACVLFGQVDSRRKFDVASMRPCEDTAEVPGLRSGAIYATPNRLHVRCISLGYLNTGSLRHIRRLRLCRGIGRSGLDSFRTIQYRGGNNRQSERASDRRPDAADASRGPVQAENSPGDTGSPCLRNESFESRFQTAPDERWQLRRL
jgi:beta-lactamase regulating signal transducer with metallopeptidase domain